MLLGRHEVPPPPYVEVRRFTTVDSLMRATAEIPRDTATILAVAAVSDYRPQAPIRGKVSSGMDKMDLSLEATPKVLPLLRSAAPDATLVSFKLEVGLSDEQLTEVARARLGKGREDMVVANDMERVSADHHPAVIIGPDREPSAFDGAKEGLAAAVFDAVEAARG